jgi:hypothetical protein
VGPEASEAEIRNWLGALRGVDLTDDEVEAAAGRLLGVGTPALPILLDLYRQEDEALLAVATQTFKRWPAPRPIERLIGLLREPGVDDIAKALIMIVLETYGLDPTRPEWVGLSINLEEYPLDRRSVPGAPWS